MSVYNRRRFLQHSGSMVLLSAASGMAALPRQAYAQDTVKLGLLHSLSGTIAIAEASLVDAEKLAIEEINASGGVMGRKIEPVVEDGASENAVFAEKARKLLDRDKVAAIVGCYTSLRARRCCRCSRAARACCTTPPTTRARSRTRGCSIHRRKPRSP